MFISVFIIFTISLACASLIPSYPPFFSCFLQGCSFSRHNIVLPCCSLISYPSFLSFFVMFHLSVFSLSLIYIYIYCKKKTLSHTPCLSELVTTHPFSPSFYICKPPAALVRAHTHTQTHTPKVCPTLTPHNPKPHNHTNAHAYDARHRAEPTALRTQRSPHARTQVHTCRSLNQCLFLFFLCRSSHLALCLCLYLAICLCPHYHLLYSFILNFLCFHVLTQRKTENKKKQRGMQETECDVNLRKQRIWTPPQIKFSFVL